MGTPTMAKDGYATDIGVDGTGTATASPALSRSATRRSGVPTARVIGSVIATPFCKFAHAVEHVHRIPFCVDGDAELKSGGECGADRAPARRRRGAGQLLSRPEGRRRL